MLFTMSAGVNAVAFVVLPAGLISTVVCISVEPVALHANNETFRAGSIACYTGL